MLPPYYPRVNHIIKLENDTKLPISPIYTYNEKELHYKKKWLISYYIEVGFDLLNPLWP